MGCMQSQCELFTDEPLTVMDDAEGGIVYYADRIAPETVQTWFAALMAAVSWRHLRRPMYDRVVDVPRQIANYWLDDPARPPCLDDALSAVQEVAPAPYTKVGLNLYRDGRDSVAPHGDRDDDLVPGQPIVLVSLGAPRVMMIRPGGGGASQRLELMPGSILVMSSACQRTHDHAIPKSTTPVGPRISLAYRVRRRAGFLRT